MSKRYTDRQKQLLATVRSCEVDGNRGVMPNRSLDLDDKESHFYAAAKSLVRRGDLARREVNGDVYWFAVA